MNVEAQVYNCVGLQRWQDTELASCIFLQEYEKDQVNDEVDCTRRLDYKVDLTRDMSSAHKAMVIIIRDNIVCFSSVLLHVQGTET